MSNQSWQSILARGQSTAAIWTQHSPAFTFGEVTLVSHTADLALMSPAGQAVVSQEDVVDGARDDRDTAIATITDLSIRAPRKMDGELRTGDPFHADLKHIRVVEITGLESAVTRGQRTVSLWEKLNARNAAMVPPRPPLLVGGEAVAILAAALTTLPQKTQAVENQVSALNDLRSDLTIVKERVDTNNKRWYAAWQGEFPVGTPERDALSQIDTGSPTPPPTVLEIAPPLAANDATTVQVNFAGGGGEHASELALQWYVEGEPEWSHEVPAEQPSQLVSDPSFAAALVHFRTRVKNSTAELFSAPHDIQM